MRIKLVCCILIIFALAACSSLRKPPQPQAKSNADNIWLIANQQELSGRKEIALSNYRLALNHFRGFAGIEGEMFALSGIARINFDAGNIAEYDSIRQSMIWIIEKIDPKQRYIFTLLDLHVLMKQADYAGIAALAKDDKALAPSARLQTLSYRLQADARLRKANPNDARELAKLAKKTGRRLAKSNPILAHDTARAHYALAYYHYSIKAFATAGKHIAKSLELDYLYEDFQSLGYAHWLAAKIAFAQNRSADAISLLMKARRIFTAFGDPAMLMIVEADLKLIEKGDKQ
ncbi:MAG: hypothetical protein Q8M98_11275 [Candidatus Cloacimonadaceae bacterium]|nr:hypothetical protein [Candidatus Cloacimonadaceae bacterium]MDP3115334.1 hypothetical protein [Candidatus Cloacimonadaceae bacterium]